MSETSLEPIYKRNFIFFIIDSILFTVGIGIIGSTTVIPDFVRRLTDSEILIGLSGSLFTIGYSLPQLFVARYIVRQERKKWWFVGPNIPVRFMLILFAFIIIQLGQERPTSILIAFFVCYGIAALGDGLVGVPWADLAATSLDGRWRARLFGLTSAITGILMLLAAPWIRQVLSENGPGFPNNYALLFAVSGVLLAISTLPGLFFHELPGGEAVDELPPLSQFIKSLGQAVQHDVPFRAFLLTSLFTILLMMSAPFYIGYATVDLNLSSDTAVPILLAMQTIGSVGGALVYAWVGARHNLQYIRVALASAALLPLCALLAQFIGPVVLYIGFLLSGLASSSNLFLAYLNWIVSYAPEDQRPTYVGLYNTFNAFIGLLAPVIGGSIAQRFGFQPLFFVSLMMALCALLVTTNYLRLDRYQTV